MTVLQGSLFKLLQAYKQPVPCRFTSKPVSLSSIETKLGLKPKPKKPPTAFFRFTSKIKPDLLQQKPDASPTEVVKLAAAEWKKADSALKSRLQDEYRIEWTKYKEKCREYDKSLSPGEREEISNAIREANEQKARRELKKKYVELGKPKRPPTSFVKFMQSKSSERGDMPFKDWQQKLGKEWEQFPEGEKSKLTETHKKEMGEYKIKLEEWKKKMIAEGREELGLIPSVRKTKPDNSLQQESLPPLSKLKSTNELVEKEEKLETSEVIVSSYDQETDKLLKKSQIYRRITVILVIGSISSVVFWLVTMFSLYI